jgi:chromosomal replication initiator protein
MYLATRVRTNVRELEGSLIRLIAYSSLTTKPLTIELAQDVLKNVIATDERSVTIDQIQKKVADYYHLKPAELKSRNNAKSVAMPRQVAMYLCKALTPASLPDIGRSFGGKHHSTVIHSIKKVEEMRQKSSDFNRQVLNLLEALK